ncbi:hypothetical protein GM708_07350 [Vibrio cholerae]|nr:hypothetical protein [Vibrio cholerae]
MPSVTQLHRSATAELAEVSGSPRPLVEPPGRPAPSEPGTIIQLRPAPAPTEHPLTARPRETAERSVATPTGGGPSGRPAASPGLARDDASQRISGIARSVAQGALEVLAGSRPLQQMARWLDPENYERLQLRADLVRCIADPPGAGRGASAPSTRRHVVVRSARVCPVGPGIYEASVVAYDQKRVRAVALRIEQRAGRGG